MKSILLLGGSYQQIVAIKVAKKMGLRTVLCDYLKDNPGQYYADIFYQTSTTDIDAVERIARKEKVDGILAYASDPAALTAAVVAERLGLPGNPANSVNILSKKHLFRRFLKENKFPVPKAVSFSMPISKKELFATIHDMAFPLVVKPTDSSGSKGVSVVYNFSTMEEALEAAFERSRNSIVVVEEYIENTLPFIVGGDVLVENGSIVVSGLMRCLRDKSSKLVPAGEIFPSGLNFVQINRINELIQQVLSSLDIKFGEFNIEVIVGEDDTPYIIEIGPRAGGNMIPLQLSDVYKYDFVEANVRFSMGLPIEKISNNVEETSSYATCVIHSEHAGVYKGIDIRSDYKSALYRMEMYLDRGQSVDKFSGADKAIGILFFKIDTTDQREEFIRDLPKIVTVKVE